MKTDILNHRVFQINYSLPYHEFGKSSTHYGHLLEQTEQAIEPVQL